MTSWDRLYNLRHAAQDSGICGEWGGSALSMCLYVRGHVGRHGFEDVLGKDERELRQQRVFAWAKAAFGEAQATSLAQRGLRLLEEAAEAFQAAGGTAELARACVDHVFSRPTGTLGQELGGVGVTLLALAAAADTSADYQESREVERVLSKPLEHFAQRNAAKNAAGLVAMVDDHAYLSAGDNPNASGDVAYRGCSLCGQPRSAHTR